MDFHGFDLMVTVATWLIEFVEEWNIQILIKINWCF